VALNWVQSQSGVSSTIIGARTLQQLEDNLAALDLKLLPKHLERLDAVSKPVLNFPAEFLKGSPTFRSAETTINGETAGESFLAPKKGQKFY
jgi:diketogulonate reductase-like aldo/keto reductase